jgi:NADH-quinone oxidoreductase subunit N
MNEYVRDLFYFLPEICLAVMAMLILVLDFWLKPWSRWASYVLCQFTFLGVFALLIYHKTAGSRVIFKRMVVIDNVAVLLKSLIVLLGFVVFVYSRKYIVEKNKLSSEYFVLCMLSMVGMMILVSANSFLSLYLGLELMALPLYALIAIVRNNDVGSEAAIKYFVMGALASGFFLYGVSLIYGETGSFEFLAVVQQTALQINSPSLALLFGLMFILVSVAFKFAVAPFHLWLPDVYEGSPISVTLFISTLPKVAAFGFALRLLMNALSALSYHWQIVLLIVAILSIIVGNLGAITQNNVRRLLGYSTIAHMGFLFLALFVGAESTFTLALNYLVIYVLMSLGVFGILTLVSSGSKEIETIKDLQGLGKTHPGLAFMLMIALLSLAGIPPLAGFYVKFFIIQALIEAGYLSIAVFAVLMTVISLYYYLKIIKSLYFERPVAQSETIRLGSMETLAASFNASLLFLLGLFPNVLYTLCRFAL